MLVGKYTGQQLKIEVWGNFYGYIGEAYEKKRKLKEAFHNEDPLFLGIPYEDCYDSSKLIPYLAPYIGKITPSCFVHDDDKNFDPTMWSLVDEVKKQCRSICDNLQTDHLPSESWLRKRKPYANRLIHEWENKSWETLRHNITAVGGIKVVRSLLGQHTDTKASIVAKLQDFTKNHQSTPSAVADRLRQQQASTRITREQTVLMKEAQNLYHAAKYSIWWQIQRSLLCCRNRIQR